MELILNGHNDEIISIEKFTLALINEESERLFSVSFSTLNPLELDSFRYLYEYRNIPITSYKLIRNNKIISQNLSFTGRLISVDEMYTNNQSEMIGAFDIIDPDYVDPNQTQPITPPVIPDPPPDPPVIPDPLEPDEFEEPPDPEDNPPPDEGSIEPIEDDQFNPPDEIDYPEEQSDEIHYTQNLNKSITSEDIE